MKTYYTEEKGIQVVVSLLKQHGVRKIVISPGTTNMAFVVSLQNDPYFEMYSSVDERSAAYLACGLSAKSGEAVVLNCTGATASRNYMSGLTEAYYRKLPIIAITSSQENSKIGHLIPQVTDRTSAPNDVVKYSTTLPIVRDEDGVWECEIKVNRALLECKRNGGGPVHLNIETKYSVKYDVKELPQYRKIDRITLVDKFPELPNCKIGVFIGSHATMTTRQTEAIDRFCASNNSVVFCDHTSNYKGKYAIKSALLFAQRELDKDALNPDLLIHVGEVSGEYSAFRELKCNNLWRINPDGEIRDTFRKLRFVFEMPIEYFFEHYSTNDIEESSYLEFLTGEIDDIRANIPELPFSNIWIASQLSHYLPNNSTIHFAILNSLRSWNYFELPESVSSMSNVGGFGIDGCTSTLIGASLMNCNELCYLITGDLAFFYDLNSLGNRHIGNNVRILIVNNGKGFEFRNYTHYANKLGDSADEFIAAGGHFGNQSPHLIRCYAENLGYSYITASNKQEFEDVYLKFIDPNISDKPIIFEVFTNCEDENNALKAINSVKKDIKGKVKRFIRKTAYEVLGQNGKLMFKTILKK